MKELTVKDVLVQLLKIGRKPKLTTKGKSEMKDSIENMLNVLQEFPQYEGIPYVADFKCANCGKSGHGYQHVPGDGYIELPHGKLVGWCEDKYGYQMVFECPICFEKYRYHNCTTGRSSWDSFKHELFLVWILQEE
jgi:hypothetical protein